MSTLTVDERSDSVLSWRFEQLQSAGYAPRDAKLLAERRDVDLHLALRLLEAGCDEDIAVCILL